MMTKSQLMELIQETLEFKKWKFTVDQDHAIFTLGWTALSFFANIKAVLFPSNAGIAIVVNSDAHIKKNIEKVAVYLARVNYNLSFGSLELNCDDGELRFFINVSTYELEAQADRASYLASLILRCYQREF